MMKITHSDTFDEVGVRKLMIEYGDFIISIIGFNQQECVCDNVVLTQLNSMRIFSLNTGGDISSMHPAYDIEDESIEIDGIGCLLKTIRLIDNGVFNMTTH